MPFKNLFRHHKNTKHDAERSLRAHKLGDISESTEEPPDQTHNTTKQAKSPEKRKDVDITHTFDQADKTVKHIQFNDVIYDNQPNSVSPNKHLSKMQSFPRTTSAPVPMSEQNGVALRRSCLKKSSTVCGSPDSHESLEMELHDQRLKDLSRIESYMSHVRQSWDEDSLPSMPNRLCCAKLLKTLLERHEQQYPSYWQWKSHMSADQCSRRSTCSSLSHSTPTDSCSNSDNDCDSCSSSDRCDMFATSETSDTGLRGEAAFSESTSLTGSSFTRSTFGRVPIPARKHRTRCTDDVVLGVTVLSESSSVTGRYSNVSDELCDDHWLAVKCRKQSQNRLDKYHEHDNNSFSHGGFPSFLSSMSPVYEIY